MAAEAEYQRLELAKLWLGKELPAWEKPCEIEYLSLNNTDDGTTELDFGTQKDGCTRLSAIRISLNGDLDKCLENGVPHNVMLAVITSGLGEALPKWAMRGLARTDDQIKVQHMLDLHCRDILNAGRGIRLRALLPMKATTMNAMDMEFQGHSVVRFLLAQKGTVAPAVLKDLPQVGRFFQNEGNEKQRFVAFLHVGLENNTLGSWNRAAKIYGFESVDALEEAWLQYLRKPESRLVPQAAPPVPVPPKPIDPNTIPPTKLPVGNTYLNRR